MVERLSEKVERRDGANGRAAGSRAAGRQGAEIETDGAGGRAVGRD